MQTIKQTFEKQFPGKLKQLCGTENFLFIDIETTGLSKENANLYLIGCGYFKDNTYNTIQWFADSPKDEFDILSAFYEYVNNNFTHLVHYNGNKFDIPFLNYKLEKYNFTSSPNAFENIDIFVLIKPLKKLLSLPSMSQRSIEEFLGYYSDDPYNGYKLIDVYFEYCKTKKVDALKALLYHNSEDLLGMLRILPILDYINIENEFFTFTHKEINVYKNYLQEENIELLLHFSHELNIIAPINTGKGKVILKIFPKGTAILRLPIIEDTLKHFYDNYKDYYYLPSEDCCIHKSVASGVEKCNRINAKKETCYIKRSGLFIPNISKDISINFKYDYKSNDLYIPYTEDISNEIFNEFGKNLINYFF